MASKLEEIIGATRARLSQTKSATDMRDLESRAEAHQPRGFRKRLKETSQAGPAVIAE